MEEKNVRYTRQQHLDRSRAAGPVSSAAGEVSPGPVPFVIFRSVYWNFLAA